MKPKNSMAPEIPDRSGTSISKPTTYSISQASNLEIALLDDPFPLKKTHGQVFWLFRSKLALRGQLTRFSSSYEGYVCIVNKAIKNGQLEPMIKILCNSFSCYCTFQMLQEPRYNNITLKFCPNNTLDRLVISTF